MGWITRQVAGALSLAATVHVITPDGRRPRTTSDSVFTVHELGSPIAGDAERRRDVLLGALSETGQAHLTQTNEALRTLIDDDLVVPWHGATRVLEEIGPDVAVIVGHQSIGALRALGAYRPDLPFSLLALGEDPAGIDSPHFGPLFAQARSIMAVTETERSLLSDHHGRADATVRIGAPMAANASARSEPNTWVGDTGYVLVLTGVANHLDHEETELSRLIRLRFPEVPVGISFTNGFCAWHEGRVNEGWPIERSSDLARLMAFAAVTVDLRPGTFFARRCVESLLYGTPIVVPHDSRAREHAERGRGGLWFDGPTELTWCVEALLDTSTNDVFGAQGRAYAEAEYGSTDRFIERVTTACGLTPAHDPVVVTA